MHGGVQHSGWTAATQGQRAALCIRLDACHGGMLTGLDFGPLEAVCVWVVSESEVVTIPQPCALPCTHDTGLHERDWLSQEGDRQG